MGILAKAQGKRFNLTDREVARRIRADHRNDSVLLVALTGWGQRQDRDRTAAAGFDHHLIKPVDFAGLAALLTRHLERQDGGRNL